MGNFVEFAYDSIYDFNVKPKSKQGKVLIQRGDCPYDGKVVQC